MNRTVIAVCNHDNNNHELAIAREHWTSAIAKRSWKGQYRSTTCMKKNSSSNLDGKVQRVPTTGVVMDSGCKEGPRRSYSMRRQEEEAIGKKNSFLQPDWTLTPAQKSRCKQQSIETRLQTRAISSANITLQQSIGWLRRRLLEKGE